MQIYHTKLSTHHTHKRLWHVRSHYHSTAWKVLDHQSQCSSTSNDFKVCLLSSLSWETKWTEDGRPAKRSDLPSATVYLHGSGLLWSLYNQGWPQRSKEVRRSLHMLGESCSAHQGCKFSRVRELYSILVAILSSPSHKTIPVKTHLQITFIVLQIGSQGGEFLSGC